MVRWAYTACFHQIAAVQRYSHEIASLRKQSRRDLVIESKLHAEIHYHIGTFHLAGMKELLTALDVITARCNEILESRDPFLRVLPQLHVTWKLEERQVSRWPWPMSWLFSGENWRGSSSSSNAERLELKRALDRVNEQFEVVERLSQATMGARRSLKRYVGQELDGSLFVMERDLESVAVEKGRMFEDYFTAVRLSLYELGAITAYVRNTTFSRE